jgi:hypothetical protein
MNTAETTAHLVRRNKDDSLERVAGRTSSDYITIPAVLFRASLQDATWTFASSGTATTLTP